jgi:hypothetical protein
MGFLALFCNAPFHRFPGAFERMRCFVLHRKDASAMTTRKKADLNLTGTGTMTADVLEKENLLLFNAYLQRLEGKPGRKDAELALIEARYGLEPDAIGTTHAINERGQILDREGRIYGLTVANPGGIVLLRKQQALDFLFGATAFPAADTTLWCGLVTGTYTGGTSDIALLQGTFTGNPEVTTTNWTNYAAVSITNNTTNWSTATGVGGTQVATKANATAISFTANATVTGTGPTPTGWFLANSATLRAAANILATGNISSGSAAVVNGAAVSFAIGQLTVLLI